MDVAAVPRWLVEQGPWGVAVLLLIAVIVVLQRRLDRVTDERIADLKSGTAALHSALVASTEAMRANTAIQDRAGHTAGALGEAMRGVETELERLREALDRAGARP